MSSIDRRTLLMDRSVSGRTGTTLPALDVPPSPLPENGLRRPDLSFPEVSEPDFTLATSVGGALSGFLNFPASHSLISRSILARPCASSFA